MCGRFVESRPVEDIVEQFAVEDLRVPAELLPGPRFNISPQSSVFAVRAAHVRGPGPPERAGEGDVPDSAESTLVRRLSLFQWGLVPSWAKDPTVGNRAFNA
ncbi:MAG: SOS response-associated peptidase family protein, partial [Acidimicrobiales bacterium]